MTFVKDASSLSVAGTLEGIFGAAYFGIGRGLGGFLGGLSTEYIGFVQTFQVFGMISLGTCLFYSLIILVTKKTMSRKYVLQNVECKAIYNESKSQLDCNVAIDKSVMG